ncbi:MAG: hypothetical protein CSA86_02695 [Arcobacter sp.]|nr:MAG: hypothetical protein CSA86_02695 [Arcobacter sp.]
MRNKIFIFFLVSFNFLYAKVLFPFEAYELALKNSSSIKSGSLQLESKEEDLNQWLSKYYPQINFSIDYNNTDYEYNRLQNRKDYDATEKSLDYSISLQQSLYNYETQTKLDVEKKRVNLFQIRLNMQKQELSKDVFKTYLLAINSQNKIDLLNSYLSYNEEKRQSIQKRYEMSISSKMDLLQITVEVNRSKIELMKEEKLYKTYLLKLKQLTNMNDIQLPQISFENFEISSIINKEDLLQNEKSYLEKNLEYMEVNEAIKLSQLEVNNAKSAHYPKLDFDARYTKFDSDSIVSDYENTKRWSVRLTVPLYSGGYVSSRVKSKKIIQKASYEDLEVVKKDLTLKYDDLFSSLKTSIKSVEVYKEALNSSKSYLDFISQGYDNGLKSSIDLFEAKNKVFEIKYEYIKNIQEFIQIYVDYLILNNNIENLFKIDNIIKKGL